MVDGMDVYALLWRAQTERRIIFHHSLSHYVTNSRLIPTGVLFHSKPRLNPAAKLSQNSPQVFHFRTPNGAFNILLPLMPVTHDGLAVDLFSKGCLLLLLLRSKGALARLKTGKYSPLRRIVVIGGVQMALQLVIFYGFLARKTR